MGKAFLACFLFLAFAGSQQVLHGMQRYGVEDSKNLYGGHSGYYFDCFSPAKIAP